MAKTAKDISELPFVRSQRSVNARFHRATRSAGRSTGRKFKAVRHARRKGQERVKRLRGKNPLEKLLRSFSR